MRQAARRPAAHVGEQHERRPGRQGALPLERRVGAEIDEPRAGAEGQRSRAGRAREHGDGACVRAGEAGLRERELAHFHVIALLARCGLG